MDLHIVDGLVLVGGTLIDVHLHISAADGLTTESPRAGRGE
jgi:hypothetical protein